jgi:hypothetical protein
MLTQPLCCVFVVYAGQTAAAVVALEAWQLLLSNLCSCLDALSLPAATGSSSSEHPRWTSNLEAATMQQHQAPGLQTAGTASPTGKQAPGQQQQQQKQPGLLEGVSAQLAAALVRLGRALVVLQGHNPTTQLQQQQEQEEEVEPQVMQCQQEPLDAVVKPCVEEARWLRCWDVLCGRWGDAHPCSRHGGTPAAGGDAVGALEGCVQLQAGECTSQHSLNSSQGAEGWSRADVVAALLSGCSWCLGQAHRLQLLLYGAPLLAPPAGPTPSHATSPEAGAAGAQAPVLCTVAGMGALGPSMHQGSSVECSAGFAHVADSTAALAALPTCMRLLPPHVALQVLDAALVLQATQPAAV